LASNSKHFPPDPGRAEKLKAGVSAAPVFWGAETAMFGVGYYDQPSQDQVLIEREDGSTKWMVPVILAACTFWQWEFEKNKW
jgi:hypothetical protein